MSPATLLLVSLIVAVTVLAGFRARSVRQANDALAFGQPARLMVRQRLLAQQLPTVRPAQVVALPVGPGAEGALAARYLLDRPEAA